MKEKDVGYIVKDLSGFHYFIAFITPHSARDISKPRVKSRSRIRCSICATPNA